MQRTIGEQNLPVYQMFPPGCPGCSEDSSRHSSRQDSVWEVAGKLGGRKGRSKTGGREMAWHELHTLHT